MLSSGTKPQQVVNSSKIKIKPKTKSKTKTVSLIKKVKQDIWNQVLMLEGRDLTPEEPSFEEFPHKITRESIQEDFEKGNFEWYFDTQQRSEEELCRCHSRCKNLLSRISSSASAALPLSLSSSKLLVRSLSEPRPDCSCKASKAQFLTLFGRNGCSQKDKDKDNKNKEKEKECGEMEQKLEKSKKRRRDLTDRKLLSVRQYQPKLSQEDDNTTSTKFPILPLPRLLTKIRRSKSHTPFRTLDCGSDSIKSIRDEMKNLQTVLKLGVIDFKLCPSKRNSFQSTKIKVKKEKDKEKEEKEEGGGEGENEQNEQKEEKEEKEERENGCSSTCCCKRIQGPYFPVLFRLIQEIKELILANSEMSRKCKKSEKSETPNQKDHILHCLLVLEEIISECGKYFLLQRNHIRCVQNKKKITIASEVSCYQSLCKAMTSTIQMSNYPNSLILIQYLNVISDFCWRLLREILIQQILYDKLIKCSSAQYGDKIASDQTYLKNATCGYLNMILKATLPGVWAKRNKTKNKNQINPKVKPKAKQKQKQRERERQRQKQQKSNLDPIHPKFKSLSKPLPITRSRSRCFKPLKIETQSNSLQEPNGSKELQKEDPKDPKDSKASKDSKNSKETKESKETREAREARELKEDMSLAHLLETPRQTRKRKLSSGTPLSPSIRARNERVRRKNLLKLQEECTELAEVIWEKFRKATPSKRPNNKEWYLKIMFILQRFISSSQMVCKLADVYSPDKDVFGNLDNLIEKLSNHKDKELLPPKRAKPST
jgi:hypothetical protein